MGTAKDNKETKKEIENGVGENEKANYSDLTPDSTESRTVDKNVRETSDRSETENEGGDIAGNAAGNNGR